MKPLEGIKVVDLTSYLAAPTTGRVLAEWGADVVKVESFGGDPARRQAGVFNMPMADDENLAFDYANFGKKFMTLNLKSETGMDVMMKLLAEADVFLTSNRTKSLVKMGLDYETLHEKFPKLVYAQVTGYGDKGPEKDAAGFDVTCYMARGGVFGTTVNRGDAPLIPTNGLGDFSVSLFLAAGIAAALYGRTATGTATASACRCSTPACTRCPPASSRRSTATPTPRTAAKCPTPSTTCTAARTASGCACASPSTTATSRRSARRSKSIRRSSSPSIPRRTSAPR